MEEDELRTFFLPVSSMQCPVTRKFPPQPVMRRPVVWLRKLPKVGYGMPSGPVMELYVAERLLLGGAEKMVGFRDFQEP